MLRFFPYLEEVADIGDCWSQDDIRREPMLFACDTATAFRLGGPITKKFLMSFAGDHAWVIDSKTAMLFPGMWPCIPGWHHDDVPRTRADGQPDYERPAYHAKHVMCVVGDASLTEFLDEPVEVPDVPLHAVIYKAWDRCIDALNPRTRLVKSGSVYTFNSTSFHRGTRATKPGWRFFIRATRDTLRPVKNEQRTQVQIYMDDPSAGW